MTIDFEGTARRICGLAVLIILPVVMPSRALAQEAARLDVFGGYSYRWLDSQTFGYANRSNLNGWNATVTGNITLKLGAFLDVSGHYGNQMDVYTYTLGPQYTWRRDRSRFFARGLFGKSQTRVNIPQPTRSYFESVGRAFGGGGGFDYDFSPRITIRVFQADYLRTDTFGATQSDVRVSTGLVFHFGHIGHRPKL